MIRLTPLVSWALSVSDFPFIDQVRVWPDDRNTTGAIRNSSPEGSYRVSELT